MSITCKVCSRNFEKVISNSHLKTHGITTVQYKELYGANSLSCPIYKKQLSNSMSGENNPNYNNKWSDDQKNSLSIKNQGLTPWNKDKHTGATQKMLDAVDMREQKYRSGELIRVISTPDTTTREKIAKSVTEYAKSLGVTRQAILLQIKEKRLPKNVKVEKIGNTYSLNVGGQKRK